MPRCVIFGFGYVASHLAPVLHQHGIQVLASSRKKENFAAIEAAGATPFMFGSPLPKADFYLNTTPPHHGADPVLATYKAADFGTPVWYGYLSTTGVYGNTHGKVVDETYPLHPITPQAKARYIAELETLTAKLPAHVFRVSGIYGPGRSAIDRLLAGHVHTFPHDTSPVNRIHVADIVQSLLISLQNPAGKSVINLADDDPAPSGEVLAYAAGLLGMGDQVHQLPPAEGLLLGPMGGGIRIVNNSRLKTLLGTKGLLFPTYKEGLNAIFNNLKAPHHVVQTAPEI